VLFLAHPNHPPHKITRTAHTSWTSEVIDFDWPAFRPENTLVALLTALLVATKWSEVHQHLDHHSESDEKIEHLESIIKWLVNHPANKVVGNCIGGGWSCDSYPDDDGTRREYFGADFLEAIELAMNGETE